MVTSYKAKKRSAWRHTGLVFCTEEEFDEILERYISSTHCEICNKKYKNSRDKHMDHAHLINGKYGAFRNVLCRSCNTLRSDNKMRSTNTSNFKNISKHIDKSCKQGYIWMFQIHLNGKRKHIKCSTNKQFLIEFADKWYIDNNYYC